jgi:hypothetical protein
MIAQLKCSSEEPLGETNGKELALNGFTLLLEKAFIFPLYLRGSLFLLSYTVL